MDVQGPHENPHTSNLNAHLHEMHQTKRDNLNWIIFIFPLLQIIASQGNAVAFQPIVKKPLEFFVFVFHKKLGLMKIHLDRGGPPNPCSGTPPRPPLPLMGLLGLGGTKDPSATTTQRLNAYN